ncbi:MAG: helix-turn-helix transcriptional regulator [Campylobacterales bacterium]|nr:helix-turn-helix transcriptional regulator [Campylobacterales bacterium]
MDFNFSNHTQEEINEFYRIVSTNVRRIRESKGMKQLDVALEIDIKSVAFYSNCENCKYGKHFNLEHLYKLAKTFEVDIQEFFAKNTEKATSPLS